MVSVDVLLEWHHPVIWRSRVGLITSSRVVEYYNGKVDMVADQMRSD
jgi:hypothetical protein